MVASDGVVGASAVGSDATPVGFDVPGRRPLYPRLLRLRHVHPNAWQRALLGEGAFSIAVLLVLADLATAWTLLVLPVAVALVVKAHDLLAGRLPADDLRHPVELHAQQEDQLRSVDVDRL